MYNEFQQKVLAELNKKVVLDEAKDEEQKVIDSFLALETYIKNFTSKVGIALEDLPDPPKISKKADKMAIDMLGAVDKVDRIYKVLRKELNNAK